MYDDEESVVDGEDEFAVDEEGEEMGAEIGGGDDFGLDEEDPDKDR